LGPTRVGVGINGNIAAPFTLSALPMHRDSLREIALHIAADHPAFAGHFPGQPLLPGVSLLAEVLEAVLADPTLAASVGATPRIASAKFLAPVRPGAQLVVRLQHTGPALRFEVREGERLAAAGQFETAS
jgi:3-hydroxyacyl-[acyl-carrier-protein] dehydratase